MSLTLLSRSLIIQVVVKFGFDFFKCDPDDITAALQIQPEFVARKGDIRLLPNGHKIERQFNSWTIRSRSQAKDVNAHLRALLARLGNKQAQLCPELRKPHFGVTWKGNYLNAGSGPMYDADVIQGMASWRAGLGHDIYQIDQEHNPPIGKRGLCRIPKLIE